MATKPVEVNKDTQELAQQVMLCLTQQGNDIQQMKVSIDKIIGMLASSGGAARKSPSRKKEASASDTFPRNAQLWFIRAYCADKTYRDTFATHSGLQVARGRAEYAKMTGAEDKLKLEAKVIFEELKKQTDKVPYNSIVKEFGEKRNEWKEKHGHKTEKAAAASAATTTSAASATSTSTSAAPAAAEKKPAAKGTRKSAGKSAGKGAAKGTGKGKVGATNATLVDENDEEVLGESGEDDGSEPDHE